MEMAFVISMMLFALRENLRYDRIPPFPWKGKRFVMFIGREEQLKQLGDLWRRDVASLVTCRGRRRIGKSTLIAEFASRSHVRFLKLEGLPPRKGVTNEMQLEVFARQLAEQTQSPFEPLTNWFDAFARLDKHIDKRAKTVVLLDEISWMGKFDVNFPGHLKYAWDNRFSKKPKLIVVLCGSVSSWIDKYILKSKGFVGRPSLNLVVPELSMRESYTFWTKRGSGSRVSTSAVVDILSITGGVPKYLESIEPALDANANISKLCFRPGGLLVDEFDEIFDDSLDENLGFKKKRLMALAEGSKSPSELAGSLQVEVGGFISGNLVGLETAGFVAKDEGINPQNGKRSSLVRYRISDNYTRFYLKYIEPNRSLIKRGAYNFMSVEQLPGWNPILGLQFESLICNNLVGVLKALDLDRTLLLSAAPYRQGETKRLKGCQIDLLLQTRRAVYVIEIKRRKSIGEEIVDEVREKMARLKVRRGMSVIPVLVYEGHVSARVEADGFFARMIPAEDILGGGE